MTKGFKSSTTYRYAIKRSHRPHVNRLKLAHFSGRRILGIVQVRDEGCMAAATLRESHLLSCSKSGQVLLHGICRCERDDQHQT